MINDQSRNKFIEKELNGRWIPGHGFDSAWFSTDTDPVDDDAIVRLVIEKLEDEGMEYSRWHADGKVIHRFKAQVATTHMGLMPVSTRHTSQPRDQPSELRAIIDAAMAMRQVEANQQEPPGGESNDATERGQRDPHEH